MNRPLRVLAVGNSYAVNATRYLCQIAKDLAEQEILVGVIYRGGCSMEEHLFFADSGLPGYWYYQSQNGDFEVHQDVSFDYCLMRQQWDIVVFQQKSADSGVAESYADLDRLMRIVRAKHPQSNFLWHMTWSYSCTFTDEAFERYRYDQQVMQDAIAEAVRQEIFSRKEIQAVIASGTLIHSLRRSGFGDVFQLVDGTHLSAVGEFAAGVMWYHVLTGKSVDSLRFCPPEVSSALLDYIKRFVPLVAKDPLTVIEQ